MSWLTEQLSGGIDKIVDATMKGLDNLFTSDDERNQAKIILAKNMNDYALAMEQEAGKFENEITERWKSDNEHFITRMVRPIGFIYIYLLYGVVMIADGNIGSFNVKEAYIPTLETLLVTYTIAYIGSRGFEKYKKIKAKG